MTQGVIEGLVRQARPVRALGPGRIFLEWLVLTLVCLAGISMIYGLRPDLALRLAEPWFLANIVLNSVLVVFCGAWSVALAFPDRARNPLPRLLAGCFLVLYSALVFYGLLDFGRVFGSPATTVPHGIECLWCILSFALIPAAWMFWRLQKLASPQPLMMGLAVVLTAIAAGCLGIVFVETEFTGEGFFVWHYLPLILCPLAGLWAGKKFFRW